MRKHHLTGLALLVFIAFLNNPARACTLFSAARGGKILTAKNMDWNNLATRALFIAPSEGKYGRMYVGVEFPEGFCNTSGMNDQGLWYAGASLPERTDALNYYDKPRYPGELVEKAMEECTTIEEVIALFMEYYEPFWNGHSMFTDRSGQSVVIEFGEKDVVFIRGQRDYQVATNYYLADSSNARWHNCYRQKATNHMLHNSADISLDLFCSIAEEVHQEGQNPTILTSIHDLVNGDVYFYNFHNFDEVVKFNLEEELEKNGSYYALPELFNQIKPVSPIAGEVVDPSSVTFEWQGEGESYELCYSTNPDFSECTLIDVAFKSWLLEGGVVLCSLPLGFFLLAGNIKGRNRWTMLLVTMFFFSMVISCSSKSITSPYVPSKEQHSITVENLQTDTLYYWKVEAIDNQGINSESSVQTFTTEN